MITLLILGCSGTVLLADSADVGVITDTHDTGFDTATADTDTPADTDTDTATDTSGDTDLTSQVTQYTLRAMQQITLSGAAFTTGSIAFLPGADRVMISDTDRETVFLFDTTPGADFSIDIAVANIHSGWSDQWGATTWQYAAYPWSCWTAPGFNSDAGAFACFDNADLATLSGSASDPVASARVHVSESTFDAQFAAACVPWGNTGTLCTAPYSVDGDVALIVGGLGGVGYTTDTAVRRWDTICAADQVPCGRVLAVTDTAPGTDEDFATAHVALSTASGVAFFDYTAGGNWTQARVPTLATSAQAVIVGRDDGFLVGDAAEDRVYICDTTGVCFTIQGPADSGFGRAVIEATMPDGRAVLVVGGADGVWLVEDELTQPQAADALLGDLEGCGGAFALRYDGALAVTCDTGAWTLEWSLIEG